MTDMEFGPLTDLCESIRRDDPGLRDRTLKASPPFQVRDATLAAMEYAVGERVRGAIENRAAADLPRIILCWSKCRAGSTAFANLLGRAGVPAFYQPLKALLRYRLVAGELPDWRLPEDTGTVCIKETSGPYTVAECLFNPLSVLLDAGYPAARITLVTLEREPLASLDSWLRKWGARLPEKTIVEHFILASLNRVRVEATARRAGIPRVNFLHEDAKDPAGAIRAIFVDLGMADRFDESILGNWSIANDQIGTNGSVDFPAEPDEFFNPTLHSDRRAFSYETPKLAAIADWHRERVAAFGLDELYASTENG